MFKNKNYIIVKLCRLLMLTITLSGATAVKAATLPEPILDQTVSPQTQSIVLAGGCFWGMQAVFQHLKGVIKVVSGYAGGSAETAEYHTVSSGTTGHAESVDVTYDPTQTTLGQILKVYFSVAHDPTELNRQGPDSGTQYRSAIFASDEEQLNVAKAYIAQLQQAKIFDAPIVTTVEKLKGFYAAEDYHQNYYRLHPNAPYILRFDRPKVSALEREFPKLYVDN